MKKTIPLYFIFFIFFIFNFNKLKCQPLGIDNTFHPTYNMTSSNGIGCKVNSVVERSNGNLVIGGEFIDLNYQSTHGNLIQVKHDGEYLPWFFCDCDYIDILIKYLNDDYLISSGYYNLWKIDSTGNPFVYSAWNDSLTNRVSCGEQGLPLLQQDSSCLFGGSICSSLNNLFLTETKNIFKFDSIGKLDTSLFHFSTDYVPWMIVESDSNHYVMCGDFHYYVDHTDTFNCGRICRVNKNFTIDTTFKTNYIVFGSLDRLIAQDDGKVIASGFIILDNGDTLSMIRFNLDGSIDTTFANYAIQTNYPESGSVRAFCKTTDGGYLIGGGFTHYQGYPVKGIVKTDLNGNIDINFFINYGIDTTCGDLLGMPPTVMGILHSNINDAYYVYGYFTGYNGQSTQPIIRLNGLSNSVPINKSKDLNVKIFPNPATDELTIEILNGIAPKEIEITNALDVTVLKLKQTKPNQQVNIKSLAAGVYFVKIKMNPDSYREAGVTVKKFIKE